LAAAAGFPISILNGYLIVVVEVADKMVRTSALK
jgi:hypothetical protein